MEGKEVSWSIDRFRAKYKTNLVFLSSSITCYKFDKNLNTNVKLTILVKSKENVFALKQAPLITRNKNDILAKIVQLIDLRFRYRGS